MIHKNQLDKIEVSLEKEETPGMSVVSSFLQVRVVELSVLTLHTSVTVLPISSTTTRGSVIEIAEVEIC